MKHAKLVEVADKLRAAEARVRELEKRAEEAERTEQCALDECARAEARVRELEARPVVVRDEGARKALAMVCDVFDKHESGRSGGALVQGIRAALNGEG